MGLVITQCGGCGKHYGAYDFKNDIVIGEFDVPLQHQLVDCPEGVDYHYTFKHH